MQEYSRACLIAFESLPKDADREGWGRPGTSLCFRYQTPVVIMGGLNFTHAACHFSPSRSNTNQGLDGMESASGGFCSIPFLT